VRLHRRIHSSRAGARCTTPGASRTCAPSLPGPEQPRLRGAPSQHRLCWRRGARAPGGQPPRRRRLGGRHVPQLASLRVASPGASTASSAGRKGGRQVSGRAVRRGCTRGAGLAAGPAAGGRRAEAPRQRPRPAGSPGRIGRAAQCGAAGLAHGAHSTPAIGRGAAWLAGAGEAARRAAFLSRRHDELHGAAALVERQRRAWRRATKSAPAPVDYRLWRSVLRAAVAGAAGAVAAPPATPSETAPLCRAPTLQHLHVWALQQARRSRGGWPRAVPAGAQQQERAGGLARPGRRGAEQPRTLQGDTWLSAAPRPVPGRGLSLSVFDSAQVF
jgi:hypothetical protein